METYSSFQKPVTFMYFWLNYCDKNHIERIPVAVKNIDHLLIWPVKQLRLIGFICFCVLTALELMIMNT